LKESKPRKSFRCGEMYTIEFDDEPQKEYDKLGWSGSGYEAALIN